MPDQGALLATADTTGLLCMFAPGVLVLAFVAFQSMRLVLFQRGAFRVPAEVIWVHPEAHYASTSKRDRKRARLRDEEFQRRYLFLLWVLVRPPDEEPVEIGLRTGKAYKFNHGDMLEVLYNPKQPGHVMLPGENNWVGLIIVGAMGLFLLCAPFLVGVPGLRW
ncbi:DUF3592 domain-containing protein [Corallococcus exiguus]|uniref:DUF3592 domain-containing protein n=1 Tax=Corallococcus exiguus TaxID=83462 RepID=UPI001A8F8A4F|nr:DUF3592 domain-containing protein [Corallococcus exiguus]MBN8472414.1 DUF3592 domain-containing protein [Corallococcus exiguus]